jgi:hypothetical protein
MSRRKHRSRQQDREDSSSSDAANHWRRDHPAQALPNQPDSLPINLRLFLEEGNARKHIGGEVFDCRIKVRICCTRIYAQDSYAASREIICND